LNNLENNYVIYLQNLKNEDLHLKFFVKDNFFSKIKLSTIKKANLVVDINLDLKRNYIKIFTKIEGFVNVQCDRCMDYFDFPIKYNGKLLIRFRENLDEFFDYKKEDDYMAISKFDKQIDLKHYIYECIVLSMPYKKVHQNDENGFSTCNPLIIEKLENLKSKKENIIDHRWLALKNFNKK